MDVVLKIAVLILVVAWFSFPILLAGTDKHVIEDALGI